MTEGSDPSTGFSLGRNLCQRPAGGLGPEKRGLGRAHIGQPQSIKRGCDDERSC